MIYFPLDQWHPPGGNRHFLAMPVLQVQAAEAAVDAGDARAMQRMTGPLKTALKRKACQQRDVSILRVFDRSVCSNGTFDILLKLVSAVYSKEICCFQLFNDDFLEEVTEIL